MVFYYIYNFFYNIFKNCIISIIFFILNLSFFRIIYYKNWEIGKIETGIDGIGKTKK